MNTAPKLPVLQHHTPELADFPARVPSVLGELRIHETGTNIHEHLDTITTNPQPYLPAVVQRKKEFHPFFIILDKNAIACRSAFFLGAFDKLFKVHSVFDTTYNPMLYNMFTFIQTTVYNRNVGKVKESPRVPKLG
ncbi:hypothetical protein CRENBAI_023532 [Crenichthys baileyi]|uniref:Uncharacterized protein n=1 Tax=Crenichthys baileyi TaxID=28760 RepID=A0AAV9RHS2_9TELE